jgi:hypothetical protein
MDHVAQSIEALADSIAIMRPDRNTIAETLRGFARYVLEEKAIEPLRAQQEMDRLIKGWRSESK